MFLEHSDILCTTQIEPGVFVSFEALRSEVWEQQSLPAAASSFLGGRACFPEKGCLYGGRAGVCSTGGAYSAARDEL